MNLSIAFLPAKKLLGAPFSLEPGNAAGECTAIAVLVPLLLAVAFWNRFPLIYYDTGAYVLEGLGGRFLVERSPVYSLFLRFAGAGVSLWTVVALQAAATSFIVVECARAVAPKLRLDAFLALSAGLVTATGLAWYVGEVEPDCFAAISVVAVYLLAFRAPALGRVRAGAVLILGSFATAAHTSHLLLAAGLWLALALYLAWGTFAKGQANWPKPNLAKPAIMAAVAVLLVVVSNFSFTGQLFVSRAGPSFLFARLLQDRLVERLLDDTCPGSHYRLCAYKDVLPPTANAWLWAPYSPFFKLGGFDGTRGESESIVLDSFVRYPMSNIEMALRDAASQFVSFRTGDQVEPQQWALRSTFTRFLPSQVDHYLGARQQRGEIDFRILNWVHVPVGYVSLLALAALLGFAIRSADREAAQFLATVLLALAANALICGALSNPHDRYQSRLIWLAPFAIALATAALAQKRKNVPPKSEIREHFVSGQISEH